MVCGFMAPDGSGRLWTAPDGCGRLRAAPVGGKRPPIVSEGYVCLWLRILKKPTDSGRLWTAPDGVPGAGKYCFRACW